RLTTHPKPARQLYKWKSLRVRPIWDPTAYFLEKLLYCGYGSKGLDIPSTGFFIEEK
ncbi:hypothetical protein CRM22_011109, partial [Opisthorchis felineus]